MTRRVFRLSWMLMVVVGVALTSLPTRGQGAGSIDPALVNAFTFRGIGPAVTSGRIVDIAVADAGVKTIYLASASGGLWKTTNRGTTWEPVFEREGSLSLGDVAVAPSNPNIVWVGTGEANNQRSSSWGDGVYKSENGGKTWTHMGLRDSQHVGRIVIHPDDPDTVYVAAVGPLWGPGKERGIYMTVDGGKTWQNKEFISQNTGFVDLAMDPRDSNVLYAAAYQRERRAYSFLGGGPESGIYKSTDGGESWTELTNGLPEGDMGRIGLDICRAQPATLYATVQARDGGVFRSDDYGASWTKTNGLNQTPWYYSQIRCDPRNPERVYTLGTRAAVSDDGGKNFRMDAANSPHVDHHALWINPEDSDHLLLGNDGGFYMSHDRGKTWDFFSMPLSQFYAINVDLREPFYYVYGGTQDNRSWGGPSATRSRYGILNTDWYQTQGGDGFQAAIDPTDPNIVYAESQNGGLVRYDVRTGERKSIRPQPAPGERGYRYNWSAPILISPHDGKVVYFAANFLFKTSDRGDSWVKVSADLTRQLDRNELPMMGKQWGRDAISRHEGTALYGNITTVDESPLKKGLLYVGTDDGLIQVSRDGGTAWTKIEKFPGVPDQTYVSRVIASRHQEGTLYATFDGHRSNDFKPYVLKSVDYGATWMSIAANLPSFGSAYVIREHQRNANLVFVGTEFGVFFSIDGGKGWTRLKNNLPTVAVHDLVIHPRENDLVLGTHGRGIWILDDLTPLEHLTPVVLGSAAHLFPARPAMQFNPSDPGYSDLAERFFQAPNPPFGITLTYSFAKDVPRERQVTLEILGKDGKPLRTLEVDRKAGFHRVTWDLRMDPPLTVQPPAGGPGGGGGGPFGGAPRGPFVLPGQYTAVLTEKEKDGKATAHRTDLTVKPDPLIPMTDEERQTLHQERMKAYGLQTRVSAAVRSAEQIKSQVEEARKAIATATGADAVAKDAEALDQEIDDILTKVRAPRGGGFFGGDDDGPTVQSVQQRVSAVAGQINGVTSTPTAYQRETLASAAADFERQLPRLNDIVATRLPALMKAMDQAGIAWSMGRVIK